MKKLSYLPLAGLLVLIASACGGGKNDVADSDSLTVAQADSLAAAIEAERTDSLATLDSVAANDSAAFNKVLNDGSLAQTLELYDKKCVEVYKEFGSDGMPLGDRPEYLEQAILLRHKLSAMEGRMSTGQKALYDSVSGYIRRFL